MISWKTIFPQTRDLGDGFGMIQVCCALYFQYNAITDLTAGTSRRPNQRLETTDLNSELVEIFTT